VREVRTDFWKESGKWVATETIEWDRFYTKDPLGNVELIHETFYRCLKDQIGNRYNGLVVTCLEPWHEHSHPISILYKYEGGTK
jgi:hypothetical protein